MAAGARASFSFYLDSTLPIFPMTAMRYLAHSLIVSFVTLSAACNHGEAVRLNPAIDTQAWNQPAASGTTNAKLAINNLNASIRALTRRVELTPRIGLQAALMAKLQQRSVSLGHFDDLDRVAELGEAMVKAAPNAPEAYIGRAKALAARHLFQQALADLDKAAELGAREGQLEAQRATLLGAIGKHSEALAIMQRRIKTFPNISSLGYTGHLLGRLGKRDEAEAAFRLGERSYHDVSPFVLADHYFQWGLMRHEAGDEDGARQLYSAALQRLPLHAHANVHLAELSSDDQAIALLKRLTAQVDEPEALGLLSELLAERSDPQAPALLKQAKSRYETLVARHPLAFADHEGWFWLGPGKDARRALASAERNLAVRRNDEAYALLIDSAVAAGETERACVAADEALAADYVRPSLRESATEAYRGCGRDKAGAKGATGG